MSLLGFGQPQTGVFQMAYVVEDIDASMRRWIEQLHVGPWFLLEHFTGERGTYRGAPAEADVALAMAWAGHMLVELIALNDDKPSVWREGIERRGHGFHHFDQAVRLTEPPAKDARESPILEAPARRILAFPPKGRRSVRPDAIRFGTCGAGLEPFSSAWRVGARGIPHVATIRPD